MILADLNQARVTLQVAALEPSGALKTNVASGTVRVYVVSGGESDLLAATALVDVGSSKWRHEWEPVSLAVGEYKIEFLMTDDNGVETIAVEDLIVRDVAEQATLSAVQSSITLIGTDLDTVLAVETGRWMINSNQMVFYASDGTTPILTFNLFDDAGVPSEDRVFERVPA